MAATAPTPLPAPARGASMGAGRIAAIVAGSVAALLALALALGGLALVWAHATQRDDDGYYTSSLHRLSTPTAAVTAEGLDLGDVDSSDWLLEALDARVRIRATRADGGPVFVGIARERDVDAFLGGVAHEQVDDVHRHVVETDLAPGRAEAAPPTGERFWAARASGPGVRTLEWEPSGGRWAAVVMNADGTPGVVADVVVAARTTALLPVGLGLLAGGALVGLLAAGLLVTGLRTPPAPTDGTADDSATAAGAQPAAAVTPESPSSPPAHPVDVHATLDEPLSRWLWAVKWLLALPHWIALAFLWAAFAVLTVVAFFAVVFTGRYPRSIFDFNAGVLRWNWRVQYYASGVLGTDRYPPFTLGPAPGYPAQLDLPYPEQPLSRGKALVKWWLLALPHYAVLAALFGAWNAWAWAPSLVMVLVVVAVAVLAVTGRYPRDVFRLLVGINRWLYRVIAYAALMRDEYPPFRLER